MTNKQLIKLLLDTDLDAEVELSKTIGQVEFKPVTIAKWQTCDGHTVSCSRCECRVSRKASTSMAYCFKCGAEMREDI